jgi:hypothetical protein
LRFGLDGLVTVEGPSERIDNTAQKPGPDGNAHNLAGSGYAGSRFHALAVIEQDRGNRVSIEGERETHSPAFEAEQLIQASVWQSGDERDAVADAFHAADRFSFWGEIEPGDSLTAAREPSIVAGVS